MNSFNNKKMALLLTKFPDDIQYEIYEFLYDRPLKQKVLNQLLQCTKCIACDNYLSPKFCKNCANFCSLSCYHNFNPLTDLIIDEYLEELEWEDNGGGNRYGP